jgi:Cu-Zn family superoxide dismutase
MILRLIAPFAVTLLVTACTTTTPAGLSATAQLTATKGNTVSGQVHFTHFANKVIITGKVEGLKPNAEHGFHIHEKGDCSSGDGLSAGGHFNPYGKPHGTTDQTEHHAGDLPSLKADAFGAALVNHETFSVSVGDGPNSILDRALIVHRDPDDYKTQPTGNSGPRVACGVIKAAEPPPPPQAPAAIN